MSANIQYYGMSYVFLMITWMLYRHSSDYGTCNWIILNVFFFCYFSDYISFQLMYLCFLNQGYNSSSMGLSGRLSKRWVCNERCTFCKVLTGWISKVCWVFNHNSGNQDIQLQVIAALQSFNMWMCFRPNKKKTCECAQCITVSMI